MPQSSPPPGTVPVRLSIRPDETAYVPEDEVPILRQQGLLAGDDDAAEGTAKPEGTAGKATGAKTPAGKDQA